MYLYLLPSAAGRSFADNGCVRQKSMNITYKKGEEIKLKITESILKKLIEKRFPNVKKEMLIKVKRGSEYST